jgi:hypothetical protein
VCLFLHDKQLGDHLSLSFDIQFFRYCVNIAFQHALTLAIEKMIMLTSDAYSRPPITIRSHDLHVNGIKGAMHESFLPHGD